MTWLSDRVVRHLQDVARAPDVDGDAFDSRYALIDEIGRGGMGAVYRARDEVLGRDVAVKVIDRDDSHGAFAVRLRQEAQVLARLEHPGIIPVHDAGTLPDGRAFYVMKLVRGASLADHLAALDRLDARLRVFERICEAVAFAHAAGIVHRDLKPANVMVGSFGEVLVLDWGLAKAVADEEPAAVAGTPGFMAPEQARGETVDARADVYALGALLVTMLTAQPRDGSANAVAARLRVRGAPVRLRAICLKAMASAPDDRYADAAALGDDVARFGAGLPVTAHRETVLERAVRFASTYRTPILLVLAYLLMRALVALYIASQS
jgi:eukaryotic-like serine/threonine-protein kinase